MTKKFGFEALVEFLRLRSTLDKIIYPVAAKYSLTPIQAATLSFISKADSVTVGSLFRDLDLNQGNVSSLCKKLENDGLITRKKSTEDERIFYISVTEKGENILAAIEDELPFKFDKAPPEDEEDLRCAAQGLCALRNIANKINNETKKYTQETN